MGNVGQPSQEEGQRFGREDLRRFMRVVTARKSGRAHHVTLHKERTAFAMDDEAQFYA